MSLTLIRWRLNEVMARHRVTGKSLAEFLGISTNAMSSLRKAQAMPRIDGERLEQLCIGITRLSKIGEKVLPYDLLEYVPEPENEPKILAQKPPRNQKKTQAAVASATEAASELSLKKTQEAA
jgi:putative transcriptional regulator